MILAILASTAAAHPTNCMRLPRGGHYERPALVDPVSHVSAEFPIRVWYDATDTSAVAIAQDVLASAELAWRVQFDEIGFREPVLPDAEDGPDFDIYLIDYYDQAAYVASDPGPDTERGDGYSSASSYMVVDHELPVELVPGFIAHELNHASQWSYDFTELTLPLWEGTATAAERWTLGPDYDWAVPVASFQQAPWMPALVGSGQVAWNNFEVGYYFEYGASLWVMWLDEKHGDGMGSGGVALWEATASEGREREPDVVDAFGDVAGMPTLEALGDFAVARVLTGARWDARGLSDAGDWQRRRNVTLDSHSAADLPIEGQSWVEAPFVTGQGFAAIDLEALEAHRRDVLEISVASEQGLASALTVLWWDREGGTGHQVAVGDAPMITLAASDLSSVLVAVTNGGPEDWDGDDDPYLVGDQVWSAHITRTPGCGCQATTPLQWPALLLLSILAYRRQSSGGLGGATTRRAYPQRD